MLSILSGQQNDPQMSEPKWIIQALNFRIYAWFFKIQSLTTCQMLEMGWDRKKTAVYRMQKGKKNHLAEHQLQISNSDKMGAHGPGPILTRGKMVKGKERNIGFPPENHARCPEISVLVSRVFKILLVRCSPASITHIRTCTHTTTAYLAQPVTPINS